MTELQSALGLSQMSQLDRFVAKRHKIADRYDLMLANLPLQTPKRNESGYSGMHLYIIRLQLHLMSKTHAQVFDALRQAGIGVNLHYIPVVSQPYFQKMGFNIKDFPESKKYYAEAISLPMYPDLTNAQQDEVCALLHEVLK
jgi:dTDP-4-amino-4,6-dideoxygalactose transaminase